MASNPIPPSTATATFLGIPPEIRTQIYKLVVTPFEVQVDKNHYEVQVDKTHYLYHGLIGIKRHARNDCGIENVVKERLHDGEMRLMLTCRKVYKEVGEVLASRPVLCELHYHVDDAEMLQPVRSLTVPGQALLDRVNTVDLKVDYNLQNVDSFKWDVKTLVRALQNLSKYPSIRQIKYHAAPPATAIESAQKVYNILNYLNNHKDEPPMLHFSDIRALQPCVAGYNKESVFLASSLAEIGKGLDGTNISVLIEGEVFIAYHPPMGGLHRAPMAKVQVEWQGGQFQILQMRDIRDRNLKPVFPSEKHNIHSLAEKCTTAWQSSKTKDESANLGFWYDLASYDENEDGSDEDVDVEDEEDSLEDTEDGDDHEGNGSDL